MTTTIFRHRRRSRTRRRAADHARARAEARLGGGARARRRRRRAHGERPRVLIGKDTRISGYLLEAALEAGLVRGRRRRRSVRAAADAGGRLPDARAAAVRRHRDQRVAQSVRRQRHQVLLRGRREAARRRRARDRARAWTSRSRACRRRSSARRGASTTPPVATSSSARARSRPSSICAAGASSSTARTAPATTSRRRCSTSSAPTSIAVGVEPDGLNINAGVGATHPQHSSPSRCKRTRRDIGIALDGDGDRLLMVDARRPRLRRRPAAVRDRDGLPPARRACAAASSAR